MFTASGYRMPSPFRAFSVFSGLAVRRKFPSLLSATGQGIIPWPPCDLHQAAGQWLESQGFFDPDKILISRGQVFFELSKEEKMKRIITLRCTHFIDDLPEFLSDPLFPRMSPRILFDPKGNHPDGTQ